MMKTCDNVTGKAVRKTVEENKATRRHFHRTCRRRAKMMMNGAKR